LPRVIGLFLFLTVAGVPKAEIWAATSEESARSTAVEFFVSPKGDDTWSGRVAIPGQNDGPFATLRRARDAVRALLKTSTERLPVRVVLRGGTYFLDAVVEFGPEDSGTENAPVTYAAAPGEQVILSGGKRLARGHAGERNGRRAWVLDVPDVKEDHWRF